MSIFLHILQAARNINAFPMPTKIKIKCEMYISFKLTKIIFSKTKLIVNLNKLYTHTVKQTIIIIEDVILICVVSALQVP